MMTKVKAKKARVTGLAVVRSPTGHIRAGNFDQLDMIARNEIRRLVELDGYITAESYPHTDNRFTNIEV